MKQRLIQCWEARGEFIGTKRTPWICHWTRALE